MGLFSFLKKAKPVTDAVIASRIKEMINFEINPMLREHEGSVELVSFAAGEAKMKFAGSCQGCAASALTIQLGVEKRLKAMIPQVEKVTDVTDHSAGTNPYYQEGDDVVPVA